MTAALLRIEGLTFGYPERHLFTDWSVDIGPGLTWIRGGDGSGKSSLLKLIAGELAGRGTRSIDGTRLGIAGDAYRRNLAWCDPQTDAFEQIDAVTYFAQLRRDRPAFDASALQRHVDGFGLAPHLKKPLYQLSTGSKRKVWLAGSLASGAALTLMDEPKAALDGPSIAHLMQVLDEYTKQPTRACIVASYEPPPALPLAGVIELPD